MEIEGKIIEVLDTKRGTSASTGKDWSVKTFILETQEQYPHKIAIDIFGEEKINGNPVVVGQDVKAIVNIDSRKRGDFWNTSVSLWKFDEDKSDESVAEPVEEVESAPESEPSEGGLPF